MLKKDRIRQKDLVTNPDPRVAVGLCLDTSQSMKICKGGVFTGKYAIGEDGLRRPVYSGGVTRLAMLQEGVQKLYDAIYESENARYCAEMAIVTFDDTVKMLQDFTRVELDGKRIQVPQFKTGKEKTLMGKGLNTTLDILEARKITYQENGVNYYQPWLVIISDGEDSGDPAELEAARQRICQMVEEDKLWVYPFALGKKAGMETLRALSPKQEPLSIEQENIAGLFKWLSSSVSQVSMSGFGTVFQPPKLDRYTIEKW